MKVKFLGCSDMQANWGSGADPREYLKVDEIYLLEDEEVHSWHTLYYLKGFKFGFNSSCFVEVVDE